MTFKHHADQYFGGHTYSQHGEDLMLLNVFRLLRVEKPSYLDLGAHHPSNISNTKLLYDSGSRGVNVEANPLLIGAFRAARPDDRNLNVGVGVEPGTFTFYCFDSTSGLNTFSKSTADELARHDARLKIAQTVTLPVTTVGDIVKTECGGNWPELLLCDIEGWDYGVIDAVRFPLGAGPLVICAEVRREHREAWRVMLFDKGYAVLCRMGENVIYVRSDRFPEVYC